MSQKDSHEDPITINTFRPIRTHSRGPVSPSNKPLQTCYAEGINKGSDTDTPGIQCSSSVLPYHFHRRPSSLSRNEYQVENLASRVFSETPVFDNSPETRLAGSNRKQIT